MLAAMPIAASASAISWQQVLEDERFAYGKERTIYKISQDVILSRRLASLIKLLVYIKGSVTDRFQLKKAEKTDAIDTVTPTCT